MIFDFTNDNNINISSAVIGNKAYNMWVLHKNGINTIPGIVIYGEVADVDVVYIDKNLSDERIYAVRSSMPGEDKSDVSNAGKYKTILGVKKNMIIDAVYEVMNSAKNEHCKAVLIQPLLYSEVSGVIFTRNPVTGANDIVIESVLGIGENCVSGEFIPDRYVYDNEICSFVEKNISEKIATYIFTNEPYIGMESNLNGIETRVVIFNENESVNSVCILDKYKSTLTDSQLNSLVEVAKVIEKTLGKPQDIEFAVKRDEIFLLQSREITTKLSFEDDNLLDNECLDNNMESIKLFGNVASKGYFRGVSHKVDLASCDLLESTDNRKVLIVREFMPELIYKIDNFGAIISEMGGLLCHAAIVSREKKIPCIVNVTNAYELIEDGKEIIVDANRGVIYYAIE